MNAQDFFSLQEEYLNVYSSADEIEETRSDISYAREAVRNARRRYKKYPEGHRGDNTKHEYELSKKAFENQVSQERKKKVSEEVDLYNIILSHLIDEGYADTPEQAEVIMVNMSEDWRESIVEEFVDPETGETPSGRSPIENVSNHPQKKVRRKAMRAFARQMGREYGGNWRPRRYDPTED